MEYAVIKVEGKQYRVAEGDIISVDRISDKIDNTVFFNEVLLLVKNGLVLLGKPTISDKRVVGRIIAQTLGEKIRVSRFKAKVRYRKSIGFRAKTTEVKIEKIESIEK